MIGVLGVMALMLGGMGQAHAMPFGSLAEITAQTSPWLIIGTGGLNDMDTPEGVFNKGIGNAVDISNFEIGANKAPVPANEPAPARIGGPI